ncbi:MAG: DNA-directed RNA polymerase [Candidatus Aenigmarchaeota archaeon]|nr:DNA-directed RNA polymerase [Candidatus Aenigmarchaeota archaeon]
MPFDRNRRFGDRRGSSRGGGFNRGRRFDRGPREMHKAVCSECGKECEVPFKPTEGKPVFCRECFAKRRPRRF